MSNQDSAAVAALRKEFERQQSGNGQWQRAVERDSSGDYLLLQSATAWMHWLYALEAIEHMGWLRVQD